MNGIEAYPLSWPDGRPRVSRRERARFQCTFAVVRDDLMNELRLLGAKMPILSTNIPVKQNGLPYAGQPEPDDPGVAVYFQYKDRSHCFACDRWNRVRDNIQAIRKTIEALRGIERWGTGDMLEKSFQGFEQLPAPSNGQDWRKVLGLGPNPTVHDVRHQYKSLARENHPDVGGDHDTMAAITAAYEQAMSECDQP